MELKDIELAVTYQRCPRLALLSYGLGIERVTLDIAETTRKLIRAGILALLEGRSLEETIEIICKSYQHAVTQRGLEVEQGEDPYAVFLEQSALIEAVLRGYALVELPALKALYDYGGDVDGCSGVPTLGDKLSGEIHAYTVRVVSSDDRQQLIRDVHSLYTVAVGAAFAEKYGEDFFGTILHYVTVGERHRGDDGIKTQRTPFITGYKQKVGGRLAPKRQYRDARTGHISRLGNDFRRFEVWRQGSPVTLPQWIQFLHDKKELASLFRSVVINPPQPEEAKQVLLDVQNEGLAFNAGRGRVNPLPIFPMHRASCDLPVCSMQQMSCCYGDIPFDDPFSTGVYRKKEIPNGK